MTAVYGQREKFDCSDELVRQAADQGAKLIVLPEMCATGYYFESMEQAAEMAESVVNGQTVGLLENLAKELDCYLVAGLPELDGERLYNSAVLIGPDGLIGRHRKMHHYVPDSTWAKTGDEPVKVFDTPIGNIGIQICMDLSYPEGPRLAGLWEHRVLVFAYELERVLYPIRYLADTC